MAQVVWTETALIDLDSIAGHIAIDKPSAAQNPVRSIFERIELLEDHPESEKTPPELSDTRYKEIVVKPCRIFYRYTEGKVFVLYIMCSERELRRYILRERMSGIS